MILVTGATGFVGRRVVAALTTAAHDVRVLVREPERAAVLSAHAPEIAVGDVFDPQSLSSACEGVTAVVHLVAVVREYGGSTFQSINYEGTRNVLKAAESAGVERFIHASTIGASSDASIPYLYSRWMAEQEVVRSPISHAIVRFSVGFGEGDEFFNVMAAQVKLSPVVPIAGDGTAMFQPIAVEDIARCLVSAHEREDTEGETIEAGGPEHVTYERLVGLVAETLGARIVKVHFPLSLLMPGVAILEAIAPRPPVTREQLKMLRLDSTTDLDSVRKAFGFSPLPLKGNIDYINRIGLIDALKINMGLMPRHIRDH